MTRAGAVVLAALLVAGLGGCEKRDERGGGMLADSASVAGQAGEARSGEPVPFPEESVPGGGAAGEMALDTVARPATPPLPDSPTPIPAEQRPGAER